MQEALALPLGAVLPGVRKAGALSPKRPAVETAGLADVFPYYAGFSFDWACHQLALHETELLSGGTVLDPWNGSGTTTLAAQSLGLNAIGLDLNPVANVIAKLRAQNYSQVAKIKRPSAGRDVSVDDDPLAAWLAGPTVRRIRQWFNAGEDVGSAAQDLLTVSLFRAIREVTKRFEGSNPTWVKRAKEGSETVSLASDELDEIVERHIAFVSSRVGSQSSPRQVCVATADSRNMPVASSSVDIIVTSPPYLTRIDYAVAYSRELALLGINISSDRSLRSGLMGTTLIRRQSEASVSFGEAASRLLSLIQKHDSKASSGYYLRQARQYLSDLASGLDEITRVCRNSATVHLVVQDSFYKDIHVPLADICIDEAAMRGWALKNEPERFPVRRTLTSLNKSAQFYKKGDVAESVLTFIRG
ncbi:DNA methyltransferase [Streptomyces sp. B3I8]|uniref:DNA methyltransferase n=1 Tax=Streptomyces sp. B3I8 TaxID=3042303 RepID=UPI00277EF0F8|nr:DNA methyltransferase [Streptomyces sp. B3I8]MDQ0789198.1 DNA modification methylase [Streptomyces sp. B3I8]